jgi:hypothetical protein
MLQNSQYSVATVRGNMAFPFERLYFTVTIRSGSGKRLV